MFASKEYIKAKIGNVLLFAFFLRCNFLQIINLPMIYFGWSMESLKRKDR